jgi:beta-N-acetylhexosaminidase
VRRLLHPLTGGVILFARNYESPAQLQRLTSAIHALREPALVIAVDHEGGRVQRFRSGFTVLPPMRALGEAWERNRQHARHLAHELGYVLAAELRAHGIDLSFTPVLDVDHGNSSVIGDRAFHSEPETVSELAAALTQGLREGGMSAVGKHFPGHGHVRADSHLELPVDARSFSDIELADLVPFARLIRSGLPAIMPAHVVYPAVDSLPASFSPTWLKRILREELGFDGLVFSDDLSMEGARALGGIAERAEAALSAGCDMVLVCNDPAAVDTLYGSFECPMSAVGLARLARLHGRSAADSMVKLREESRYVDALHAIAGVGQASGELPLA